MYTQQYRMYYNQPQYRYKNRFDMVVFTSLLDSTSLPIFIGVGLAITIIVAIALSSNKKSIPDAKSCSGWDCEVEGQTCPKGVPGSANGPYCCKNKKWVAGACTK